MFSFMENSSRHSFSFEEPYEFRMNVSLNESIEFFQMMREPWHSLSQYLQKLYTFYIPVIIVVGFIGNFLSFLVLSTTHLKLRSSSYYLAALAVSDFGFLIPVLSVYCSYIELFELFNREGFCQLLTYMTSVCSFLSVWLTVAFTTERFIAVKYPLRRQYICTVSRARTIVFGITLVALLSQVHVFWMAGLNYHDNRMSCEMKPHYVTMGNIINCLDTFITFIIPVILILIMNVIIGKVVFQSRNLGLQENEQYSCERVRFHHVSSQSSDSTKNSDQEYSTSSRKIKYEDCSLRRNRHTRTTSVQIQQNINKMLLLISSVFIALNFPSYVLRATLYFGYTLTRKNPPDSIWCAQELAMLLYYTNFSINFLLYTMCGKSFRLCLKKMFRDFYRNVF